MGIRFRRSIKLAPGIRMNFSGSGVSWTVGPRGASLGFGSRGTYLNTGVPGTGLYSRQRLDSGEQRGRPSSESSAGKALISVKVSVHDDGAVTFTDASGTPLPERLLQQVKREKGDAIRGLMQDTSDNLNRPAKELGEIHLHTPDPHIRPHYKVQPFQSPAPAAPVPKRPGILGWLFKRWRERIERQNAEAAAAYEARREAWTTAKRAFDAEEARKRKFLEHDILTAVQAMETHLAACLEDITWPRETATSFELVDEGRRVFIDVDLPEVEHMPRKTYTAPVRSFRLSVKELSSTQVQKLYMHHVHGVGFRVIGEVFSALPTVEEVTLSAYSQRADPATGQMRDDYLYSVHVSRPQWQGINFGNLANLDVVEAFSQFELRRDMGKTGMFKPVEPLKPSA